MKLTHKIKLFAMTTLLAMTLVACDDPVVNGIQTAGEYTVQTVQVANDMVSNTVVDGCGAFNPCN